MSPAADSRPGAGRRSGAAAELRRQLVGTTVAGRYRCIEVIGGGGMGTVYRAEHLRLGRHFALKVLHQELSDEPAMVQRFERESRAAASLSSEHIVGIVDAGELEDGSPFFVMDLLLGSDLRKILRHSPVLTPVRAVNLVIDVCRGLHVAHEKQLVHRDLKPENLLVLRGDDGRELCKILDFGVAKGAGNNSTRPGSLIGTARYMAPEQIGLDHPVGPHTDLYAVAVILYECVAGAVPFDGDSTERILYRIMTSPAPSLAERCPDLPKGLSAVVDRTLSRDPSLRPSSARALAEALMPFAGSRISTDSRWLVPVATQDPLESTEQEGPGLLEGATVREQADRAPSRAITRDGSMSRRMAGLFLAAALGAGSATAWRQHSERVPTPAVATSPTVTTVGSVRDVVSVAPATPTAPPLASSQAPSASGTPPPDPKQARTASTAPSRRANPASSARSISTRPSGSPPASRVPETAFDPLNPYAH